MASPAFDTLKAANSLKAAGFDDRQAEAVVTTVGGAMTDNLVTKQDLDGAVAPLATKAELKSAVAPLATKAELKSAVAPLATKAELKSAVASLATKAELSDGLAPLVTKAELSSALEPMVTKAELDSTLKAALEAALARMVSQEVLQTELTLVQQRMTIRLGGMLVAGIGVLAVLSGVL